MVDGVCPPRRAARQGLQVMDICRGQHGRGHRRHPQGVERVHRARGLRPPVPQVGERSPTDRNRRRTSPSMGNARLFLCLLPSRDTNIPLPLIKIYRIYVSNIEYPTGGADVFLADSRPRPHDERRQRGRRVDRLGWGHGFLGHTHPVSKEYHCP